MTNAQTNAKFLTATDGKTRAEVLENIAAHYGITQAEALREVTDEEAEHLLDYVTGPMRGAVSVLMQRRGLQYAAAHYAVGGTVGSNATMAYDRFG